WDAPKPFRSDATGATAVPYPDDYAWGEPYRPESVLANLKKLIAEFQPTRIFAPHPADGNPDHRAGANFVRLALLELQHQGVRPEVFFYVVHFGAWPSPYGYHPDVSMKPPVALRAWGTWFELPLTRQQTEAKYAAIRKNVSQLVPRPYFLVALAKRNELFVSLPTLTIPIFKTGQAPQWSQTVRNPAIAVDNTLPRSQLDTSGDDEVPVRMGLKQTHLFRQGNSLGIWIEPHNMAGLRCNTHLFLYGYGRNVSFAKLPKLHINLNPLGQLAVYDHLGAAGHPRAIAEHGIVTELHGGNRKVLRVPLDLLGTSPLDYLFTATMDNLFQITPNHSAWELYSLGGGAGSG
ncbi:MAG: hypothetical protein N3B01_10340, partial [Verrucomicrobiae bacterium]|nr:hypothetical protein [Verrucomicrobiae bacterium]